MFWAVFRTYSCGKKHLCSALHTFRSCWGEGFIYSVCNDTVWLGTCETLAPWEVTATRSSALQNNMTNIDDTKARILTNDGITFDVSTAILAKCEQLTNALERDQDGWLRRLRVTSFVGLSAIPVPLSAQHWLAFSDWVSGDSLPSSLHSLSSVLLTCAYVDHEDGLNKLSVRLVEVARPQVAALLPAEASASVPPWTHDALYSSDGLQFSIRFTNQTQTYRMHPFYLHPGRGSSCSN